MLLLLFNSHGQIVPFTPNLYSRQTWLEGLISVIQGVWPELTGIYKAQNLNRTNWEKLVGRNILTAPYCIIETGESYQEDWARDSITWRQPVSVWYVCSTTASSAYSSSASGYDATRFAESKAIDLASNLLSYSQPPSGTFQLMNIEPQISVSEWSVPNQTLYTLQMPFFISEVRTNLLWGASNLNGDLWVT